MTVTATNTAGSASATSAAVSPTPTVPTTVVTTPKSTALPVITGLAKKGMVLNSSTGSWSNVPTAYAYQWQWSSNGGTTWLNVNGATRSTFDVTATFVNARIRVTVKASNTAGAATASSASVLATA